MTSPRDPLHAVSVAADDLGATAWAELPVAELPGVVARLATIRAQVEAAMVEVTDCLTTPAAGDELGRLGWASVKDFLTHVTGGRKGAGGALIRAAEQTADLPRLRQAMRVGAVSLAQARAIGGGVATLPRVPELRDRVADRLLDLVTTQGHDATDVDRAFVGVVREIDPDGAVLGAELDLPKSERGAHRSRFLSFAEDTLGGVRVRGYATVEDAEIVKAALLPLAAPQTTEPGACGGDPDQVGSRRDGAGRRVLLGCPDRSCAHDGRDPREHGTRLWDALIDACRRLQARDDLPHAHGAAARLTVTIDVEALTSTLEREGLVPGGASLSAAAVRRLACDAEVVPAVLGSQGQVLDVGRTQRLVTSGLWQALVLRDQHCVFPGCARLPIACDAHHLTHWADGGVTSLDNLALLCRRHHTLTHHTPWQVRLDPETRRPVWTPPSAVDDRSRFSYHPPSARPAARPPHPPPQRVA